VLLGENTSFVTAVLTRPTAAPVRVVVDGDAAVEASGTLRLAGDDVELSARRGLRATARQAVLQAVEGQLMVTATTVVGQAIDVVAEKLTQRLGSAFRTVQGLDHAEAGQVEHRAKGLMRLRAKFLVSTGSTLAKTDAPQVHIG
jgi:hypothetical protein